MKAEMDSSGLITLTPESSLEEFALKAWIDKAFVRQEDEKRMECGHWRGSMLKVEAMRLSDEAVLVQVPNIQPEGDRFAGLGVLTIE